MSKPQERPSFLAVDFYCGAGGTTRGLIDAGGYVIAGVDKDPTCRATYVRNNHNVFLDAHEPAYIEKDMFETSVDYPDGQQDQILDELSTLITRHRAQAPEAPLMFAICAPCQSFTKFVQPNMTQSRSDARERDQDLLTQTLRFIEEFRPDMILSENVAGISRGKYRHVWTGFQENLCALGYVVGDADVCASNFGVPQKRRRSILLAVLDKSADFPKASLTIPREDPSTSHLSVRGAIDGLPNLAAGQTVDDLPNHQCRNLSEVNVRRLMSVEPGQPNFDFPEDLQLPCHRRLADKGKRGFGDVYTRVHPDRPAPTITTRFHSISNGRFGHYDPDQARGLSLHEGALLQSFPPDYEFYGSGMDAIAKMIGNAVPPKLSEFMARHLAELYSAGVQR